MSLPSCLLQPDATGYSVNHGAEVLSVKLDGGASRFRRDLLGSVATVDVQWSCSVKNYNYLMAFFRKSTAHGSLPFEIDLVLDTSDIDTYTCYFVPGTMKLVSQQGLTYVVRATLEVTPIYPSDGDDTTTLSGGIE